MVLFILGIIIIALNFWDFFYSTLSSNGFGWMSKFLNKKLSSIIVSGGHTKLKKFSGLLHLLISFATWVFFLFLGSYLIFMSYDSMVIRASTHEVATALERFYFTSAILTTLGIGDFIPGNVVSEIFTALIAFSGFVTLTTAISYLINVLNGVNKMKSLATYIYGMGGDLNDLYDYCKIRDGRSNLVRNSSQLRELIISYTSQHWSLPIIHYFFSMEKSFSVVIQITRLYEVLRVMSAKFERNSWEAAEIESLQNAINYLLTMALYNKSKWDFSEEELQELRKSWRHYDDSARFQPHKDKEIDALLKSAGWSWKEVYTR